MAHFAFKTIEQKLHHIKQKISGTRARYREGKRLTAVKAYTVSQESCCLLIQGVPAVGAENDFRYMCEQYGELELHRLDEYNCEEFTEAYLVKYHWFPAARTAKKQLDDKPFLGGILHVCYAPEYESVEDTSQKLQERRKFVSAQLKKGNSSSKPEKVCVPNTSGNMSLQVSGDPSASSIETHTCKNGEKRKSFPMDSSKPVTYIWAGKEYTVYPKNIQNTNKDDNSHSSEPSRVSAKAFVPRQLMQKTKVLNAKTGSTDVADSETPKKFSELPIVTAEVRKLSVPNVEVSLKRRKLK